MSQPSQIHETVPRYIFGAGEMADHVVHLLEWMGRPIQEIQLFDDGFPARRSGPSNLPVVGTMSDGVQRLTADRQPTIIAIGTKGAAFKWALYQSLKNAGVPLVSVVHSSVAFAPGAHLGENAIVFSGGTLAKNAVLGAMCVLSTRATVEHDNAIGDNVFLGPACVTGGHVRIGSHAFIGLGAVIAPGVTIGERALIGAGAVVVRDIPPGAVATGVPARVQRDVTGGMDAPTLEDLKRLGVM